MRAKLPSWVGMALLANLAALGCALNPHGEDPSLGAGSPGVAPGVGVTPGVTPGPGPGFPGPGMSTPPDNLPGAPAAPFPDPGPAPIPSVPPLDDAAPVLEGPKSPGADVDAGAPIENHDGGSDVLTAAPKVGSGAGNDAAGERNAKPAASDSDAGTNTE